MERTEVQINLAKMFSPLMEKTSYIRNTIYSQMEDHDDILLETKFERAKLELVDFDRTPSPLRRRRTRRDPMVNGPEKEIGD